MNQTVTILVMEYITGGGMRKEALPQSLAVEGEAMLQALVKDLLEIPQVTMIIPRDSRLEPLDHGERVKLLPVGDSDFDGQWRCSLDRCDAVWPIAPETDSILETLSDTVENAHKVLLGSPAAVVKVTASKIDTINRLQRQGVTVVPTYPLTPKAPALDLPWVVKPDDGVGCEGLQIVENLDQRQALLQQPGENKIVQPFMAGDPMSLSLLCREGNADILSCNRMNLDRIGDGFSLSSCEAMATSGQESRFQSLADAVTAAFPALWGYVGVDFLMTCNGPRILEINPRLTTSYAGLKRAIGYNLAEKVLRMAGLIR